MQKFLRSNVVIEPLWNEWHAWPLLLPPISAGLLTARHHLPRLISFLEDPARHARLTANPAMLGGPYVDIAPARVAEVEALIDRTRRLVRSRLELSAAWSDVDRLLGSADGGSLGPLYDHVPEPLRGLVELVYDRRNVAAAKPFEALIYDVHHDPSLESFDLFVNDAPRPFAFSTPRLRAPGHVRVSLPFRHAALDKLAASRISACDVHELARALEIAPHDLATFASLFTDTPPAANVPHDGDGVRVRYFGHACVLLETRETTVLVDPWLGYPCGERAEGPDCFGFADLPEVIDFVLVTHAHADHLVLETLLQLRHKIGTVVVPRSGWSVLDPSLALLLRRCGFASVREVDAFEEVPLADGSVLSMPFLGEHADLAIRAKATYRVELGGRGFFFAADANNLEPRIYAHAKRPVDVLFVGMECVGAPLDWLYGEFLARPVSVPHARSRRLDGSDAAKAIGLVDTLAPSTAAFVYALGHEPWLTWLSAVRYEQNSPPITESERFIADCRSRELYAERLFGNREFVVAR